MKNFGHRLAAHIEPPWERRPPPIGRWSTVEFDRVGPLHPFSDTHEVGAGGGWVTSAKVVCTSTLPQFATYMYIRGQFCVVYF